MARVATVISSKPAIVMLQVEEVGVVLPTPWRAAYPTASRHRIALVGGAFLVAEADGPQGAWPRGTPARIIPSN